MAMNASTRDGQAHGELGSPSQAFMAAQAYLEAEVAARRRVSFFGHAVIWAGVVIFLWSVADFEAALVVGLSWGTVLAYKGYRALLAPELERRFIGQEMAWRLEHARAERRLKEGKKARSLEELSASIAHEIRNPIAAAKSLVQQIGEDPGSTDNVEYARVALAELARVEQSISHLLRFAREEPLRLEAIRLTEVVAAALETFKERVATTGVRVDVEHDGDGCLRGDADKLRRVVINLISNAIDALTEARTPEPRISVRTGENLAGTEVWLEIADNGPGLPATLLERAFNPFTTSKSNGTGLGLPISKKLVELHGGTMEVRSETGAGACFTIVLPKDSTEGAAA